MVRPSLKEAKRVALVLSLLAVVGCGNVRPYEREFLADPIMSFDDETKDFSRNVGWLETREGSTGGAGGAGGGCACK